MIINKDNDDEAKEKGESSSEDDEQNEEYNYEIEKTERLMNKLSMECQQEFDRSEPVRTYYIRLLMDNYARQFGLMVDANRCKVENPKVVKEREMTEEWREKISNDLLLKEKPKAFFEPRLIEPTVDDVDANQSKEEKPKTLTETKQKEPVVDVDANQSKDEKPKAMTVCGQKSNNQRLMLLMQINRKKRNRRI